MSDEKKSKSPIIVYFKNHVLLSIFIALMGLVFYIFIPDISILGMIERIAQIPHDNNRYEAIVSVLNEKNKEIDTFIIVLKFTLTIILILISYIFSYFYYTQEEFGNKINALETATTTSIDTVGTTINTLKEDTNKSILGVGIKIHGIENILKEHFEDYAELIKYNNYNTIVHHNIEHALTYDIKKINELKANDTYESTVILTEDYLDKVDKVNLLQKYIKALQNKALDGTSVKRVIITNKNLNLNKELKKHFNDLKECGIKIKIIQDLTIREIREEQRKFKNISKNFVIINGKEVAFAYPHDGFRFAINLIDDNSKPEVTDICQTYKSFFDSIYENADEFEGN